MSRAGGGPDPSQEKVQRWSDQRWAREDATAGARLGRQGTLKLHGLRPARLLWTMIANGKSTALRVENKVKTARWKVAVGSEAD
jgi:hypothetical protein